MNEVSLARNCARFVSIFCFAALLASCGDSEPAAPAAAFERPTEGSVVSARTSHGLRQDAIRQCMLKAGFEFAPPAFADRGESVGAVGRVYLTEADTVAYGGVFRSVEFLTPGGEPAPDLPPSQFDAYAEALNGGLGRRVDEHSHGTGSHSHEDGVDHTHSFAQEGCYSVGDDAVDGLLLEEGTLDLTEVFERLSSTPEYQSFSEQWADCLASKGVQLRSASPVDHALSATDHYFKLAQERFVEIFSSGDSAYFDAQYHVRDVLTQDWFLEVVSKDQRLAEIHAAEVAEAQRDRDCRALFITDISPILAEFD